MGVFLHKHFIGLQIPSRPLCDAPDDHSLIGLGTRVKVGLKRLGHYIYCQCLLVVYAVCMPVIRF